MCAFGSFHLNLSGLSALWIDGIMRYELVMAGKNLYEYIWDFIFLINV